MLIPVHSDIQHNSMTIDNPVAVISGFRCLYTLYMSFTKNVHVHVRVEVHVEVLWSSDQVTDC